MTAPLLADYAVSPRGRMAAIEVDPTECLDRCSGYSFTVVGVGHVGADGEGRAALGFDHGGGGHTQLVLAIDAHDSRALAGQEDRCCAAVADAVTRGAGTGDDGDRGGRHGVDHDADASATKVVCQSTTTREIR